jgi:hypothetical protein
MIEHVLESCFINGGLFIDREVETEILRRGKVTISGFAMPSMSVKSNAKSSILRALAMLPAGQIKYRLNRLRSCRKTLETESGLANFTEKISSA